MGALAPLVAQFERDPTCPLPVPTAQAILAAWARPQITRCESAPLGPALLGRILATDVVSPLNVPAHDNAAMDGYALHGQALSTNVTTRLRIIRTVLAGDDGSGDHPPVPFDACVRIMTGAAMPPDLDTVIPQEDCKRIDGDILIPPGAVHRGAHRRRQGEDLQAGQPALHSGRILTPADLGLLGALGQGHVTVRPRLRVAVLSTGSELRAIGEHLPPGCVYDSNRYTLLGMLSRLGVDVLDLGLIRDDAHRLEAALREAGQHADVILTSGGIGGGDADHTLTVAARLGEVLPWQLALRPGRPLAVGCLDFDSSRRVAFFGLPGNPVAVMVTFYALVRDALRRMAGAHPQPQPTVTARSTTALNKRPGRTEYQRTRLRRDEDGTWHATLTGAQGSGMLRGMSEAHGLIVLPHAQGPVAAGDWVQVLPFEGLI